MEFYESPFGVDSAQMNGSCDVCQQASGEPDWFDPAYGGFVADGFESECGCDDMSSMGMPAFVDGGYEPQYGMDSQCGMDTQCGMSPYGCDACAMTPDVCGCAAPMGFPSACNPYNTCEPVGCAAPAFGCQTCCPCGNAAPVWLGAEALIWNTTSSSLPPLVTTSENGTQQSDAGIIGRPATQVLYGGNNIFGGMRGGFRLRGGVNFDQCGVSGLDLEYFMLGSRLESYHADSTGDPILPRPFLNAESQLNDAQLVASGSGQRHHRHHNTITLEFSCNSLPRSLLERMRSRQTLSGRLLAVCYSQLLIGISDGTGSSVCGSRLV